MNRPNRTRRRGEDDDIQPPGSSSGGGRMIKRPKCSVGGAGRRPTRHRARPTGLRQVHTHAMGGKDSRFLSRELRVSSKLPARPYGHLDGEAHEGRLTEISLMGRRPARGRMGFELSRGRGARSRGGAAQTWRGRAGRASRIVVAGGARLRGALSQRAGVGRDDGVAPGQL
jgi:hypothetical protein